MGIGGGETGGSNPTIPGSSSGGGSQWNNSSGSGSTDPQSIWGGQSPYLEGLYEQASGLGGSNTGQAQAQGIYDQAMGGFNSMMNPGMNPQMAAYSREIGNQFNEQIMPGIQGSAGMAGQMGGGRQGVAEGVAAGRHIGRYRTLEPIYITMIVIE